MKDSILETVHTAQAPHAPALGIELSSTTENDSKLFAMRALSTTGRSPLFPPPLPPLPPLLVQMELLTDADALCPSRFHVTTSVGLKMTDTGELGYFAELRCEDEHGQAGSQGVCR